VVFAPGESVSLFSVELSDEDGLSDSDSDSEDEIPPKRISSSSVSFPTMAILL